MRLHSHSNILKKKLCAGTVAFLTAVCVLGGVPAVTQGQTQSTSSNHAAATSTEANTSSSQTSEDQSQQTSDNTKTSTSTQTNTNNTQTEDNEDKANKKTSDGTNNNATTTGTTTVATGDVQAAAVTTNKMNTKDVTVAGTSTTATSSATSSGQTPLLPTASSSSESPSEMLRSGSSSAPTSTQSSAATSSSSTPHQSARIGTTSVHATNTATTTNNVTVNANTGGNTASSSNQAVQIKTGDAAAYASIVNQVNTTFFQSPGAITLLNNLKNNISSIDLRRSDAIAEMTGSESTSSSTRSCNNCSRTKHVKVTNRAQIENNASVRSTTGNNTASGTSAAIETGDAYAAADIVNVANTTVINGGYLLLSFQNFGDWSGDIVFPNNDEFTDTFSGASGADTGDTVASTTDSPASASPSADKNIGTVVNNSNNTVTDADQFVVAIRVHGDWAGEVFNAPGNVQWRKDDTGLRVFTLASSSSPSLSSSDTVSTDNEADITNNVDVHALTGSNQATSSAGNSRIQTGDTYAASNVINVVNTNVVGQNMLLAVLNIFGDWNGNVSFGQPDLWVGGVADTSDNPNLKPGDTFETTFDIHNRGDADAHDVTLRVSSQNDLSLAPVDGTVSPTSTTQQVTLPIEDIPAGETVQANVKMKVNSDLSDYNRIAKARAAVSLKETDGNTGNNEEVLTVTLNQKDDSMVSPNRMIPDRLRRRDGQVLGARDTNGSPLRLTHDTRIATTTATSSVITYTMQVKNTTDQHLYGSEVVDMMMAKSGSKLNKESFKLGKIRPNEEINISYTSLVQNQSTEAINNQSQVHAYSEDGSLSATSSATSTTPLPTVAGDTSTADTSESSAVCSPYMETHVWPDKKNNSQAVEKLQQFLIEHEEMDQLEVTGRYDAETESAVRKFQEKYSNDILAPWGLTRATGNVYRTTVRKINELVCDQGVSKQKLQKLRHALGDLESSLE